MKGSQEGAGDSSPDRGVRGKVPERQIFVHVTREEPGDTPTDWDKTVDVFHQEAEVLVER